MGRGVLPACTVVQSVHLRGPEEDIRPLKLELATTWVLETEPSTSAAAAGARSCKAIGGLKGRHFKG